MTQTPDDLEELRDIVGRHDVVYEVRRHEDVVKFREQSKIVKDGFDLTLCGTHDHGHSRATPGCEICADTYRDLEQIARWITPAEERPSLCRIQPFDAALYSVRTPNRRLEVELNIQIQHRRGWDEPIDECEKRCLTEMEQKLKTLGVRRR